MILECQEQIMKAITTATLQLGWSQLKHHLIRTMDVEERF